MWILSFFIWTSSKTSNVNARPRVLFPVSVNAKKRMWMIIHFSLTNQKPIRACEKWCSLLIHGLFLYWEKRLFVCFSTLLSLLPSYTIPYYNTKVFALVSTPFKRFADTFNRAFNTVMCVLMESFPHIRMQSWYKITMVILIIIEFFPLKVTDIITNIIWNHWYTCNHTNYTYYTYQHCYDRIKITITHHHTYSTQLSWPH